MTSWEEYLATQQAVDGVQFTWNLWPHSRVDAQKLIVPVACFYTPLKERPADQPQQPALEYDPVLCQKATCKAILNPLCFVDFRAKTWVCPFCNQRNPFPAHYAAIAEDNRPPELYPQFSTIDYTLKKATTMPPIFMFVVDTCITLEELKALKESLQTALSLLPADAVVGIISFGRMGTKEVAQKQLKDILAMNMGGSPRPTAHGGAQANSVPPGATTPMPMGGGHPGSVQRTNLAYQGGSASAPIGMQAITFNKFLQPISECDESINDIIDQITVDRWPIPQGHRPLRATGAALAVAVTLLEHCFPNTGARIMIFIGGACTHGPGAVVGEELKTPIRSWHTIKEDNAVYMKKATKFYDSLAVRAVKNGHVIDIYSCALDQTGLLEMKNCFNSTGGCTFISSNKLESS
uniref:Protein transport protein SEC23 n=1 Tax=Angiostrongylus cantonensis TaxID=6313 RepID=A0A158PA76_ANGCA